MAQVEVAVEDLAGARDNRLFSRRTQPDRREVALLVWRAGNRRDLQIPVKVINDGQAAALAEGMLQRATVVSDIFVVVIGTGIAGAHLVDGIVR